MIRRIDLRIIGGELGRDLWWCHVNGGVMRGSDCCRRQRHDPIYLRSRHLGAKAASDNHSPAAPGSSDK
jgi:hypothetical protein